MIESSLQMRSSFPRVFRPVAAALLALAAFMMPAGPAHAQNVSVTAPHVLLLDFKSGSILYSRAADEPVFPANMAKLMTLAVVFRELKSGKLTLDTEFPVSNHAWRTGGAPSGVSTMFAAVRSRIRVEDLIIGMVVALGNDAAIVLAEGLAGSEQAFAQRMNMLATELGLTSARFRNPTGFQDAEQRISVRDLAKLTAHLIREYPDYYAYFKVPEITWSKIKQSNRNPLLGSSLGVDGLLTGSGKESGFGYAASAVQNGQRLIAIVHGAKSDKDRVEDVRRLLDWGFRSFSERIVFTAANRIAHAQVFGGASRSVPLVANSDIRVLSLQGVNERFTARVVYEGPLRAPVAKGAEVARLRIYRGDQIAYEAPLFAAEDVAEGGLFGRAFDSAYEYVAGLVRSTFRRMVTRST